MTVVEIFADIFESALFVIFLDVFNTRKYVNKKAYISSFLCFMLLFINILLSDSISIYNSFPIIFDFGITICYARLCLCGNFFTQISSIVLYYVGMFSTSIFTIWYMAFTKEKGIILWMDTNSHERILAVIVCKFLLLIYVVLILKIKTKFKMKRSKEGVLTFIFTPCIAITLVMFMLEFVFELYYMDERGKLAAGIMAGIAVLVAVNIYLYLAIVRRENIKKEKEYALALMKEQKITYQNLSKQHEKMQAIEHDMKNRLLGIRHYFLSGETEEGIKKINDILSEYSFFSKNDANNKYPWEMVISNKLNYARQQGISVNSTIKEGTYLIDEIDFCIILGNLLDNAIEAEQNVKSKNINLFIAEDKGVIYAKIQNNIEEPNHIKLFETSKTDKVNHGIGIRSVKEIIKKYDGTIRFNVMNNKFEVSLLLKNPCLTCTFS